MKYLIRPHSLVVIGTTLPLGFTAVLFLLAPYFAWHIPLGQRPIALFLWCMIPASILFTLWYWHLARHLRALQQCRPQYRLLLLIFIIGVAARILLLPTEPILEDDYYRYLWDGAVAANALNPYQYAPAEFATSPDVESLLQELGIAADVSIPRGYEYIAAQGEETLLRVNNPHIATIYPPLAQFFFALAYWSSPFSLIAWKLIILIAELTSFALMAGALKRMGLSVLLVAGYWWHPLVLKEFANSAHMDALLVTMLSLALWLYALGHHKITSFAIALAAAVKFWPAMLVAAFYRRSTMPWLVMVIAGVLGAWLVAPQIFALADNAGLVRYSSDWERNALIFSSLRSFLGLAFDSAGTIARLIMALVMGFLCYSLWSTIKGDRKGAVKSWSGRIAADPVFAAAALILALCLLSPTGYPWYSIWLLPFAVMRPQFVFLALPGFAAFYYLEFWFIAFEKPDFWVIIGAIGTATPAISALFYMFLRTRKESAYALEN